MERSLIAFEHFREASQKFEYFILGISVALCAYIGQTLQPEKFSLSPYLLQVLALLFIASSAVVAFKRLELDVHIRKLNHASLHHREVLSALAGHQAPFITNYGEYFSTDEQVSKQLASSRARVRKYERMTRDINQSVLRLYRWRNYLLAIGFALLIVGKALSPYFPHPPQPRTGASTSSQTTAR